MSRRTPPRLAEALLERMLGGDLSAEGTLGDLAEGYHRMCARRSRWRADLWYLWQAATLLAYGVAVRRPSRSGRFAGELRWAARLVFRRPMITLAVTFTLGLGLGANAAVFSVIDGTFRATSWWSEPERTVAIWPGQPFSRGQLSWLMDNNTAFEMVGAYRNESFAVALGGQGDRSVAGAFVSPELFQHLRVHPVLGRGITEGDAAPDAEPTVVLSHGLWMRELGGDPEMVGRRIEVNGKARTVVGIQGPGGEVPGVGTEAWMPLVLDPADPEFFPAYDLEAVGVLRVGATVAEAQADFRRSTAALARRFAFFFPADYGQQARVELATDRERDLVRTPLFLLLSGTLTLLIVAAINVGHMLAARTLERGRELAVRRALGASRGQVVRQLTIEAGLLAGLSTVAGLLMAAPAARLLTGTWAASTPVARSAWTSPAVAGFLTVAALLAWVVLAGVPIAQFLATDRRDVMSNVRSGSGSPRILVATQAALATVLLAAAVLLVGTVRNIQRIPLGFDAAPVSTFRISPPADLLDDPARLRQIQQGVVEGVAALPGVEAVGLTSTAPLSGVPIRTPVNPEDQPVEVAEALRAARYSVDPGFFRALDVHVVSGRTLDESDRGEQVRSVVVNRALAARLWPGADPVGKRIAIDPHGWRDWVTVVGQVEDIRSEGLLDAPTPALYVALGERLEREATLLVRGGGELSGLAEEVRAVVREVWIQSCPWALL